MNRAGRRWIVFWLFSLLVLLAASVGLWRSLRRPLPDRLVLRPATFAALPGWTDNEAAGAIPPLLASCAAHLKHKSTKVPGLAGSSADWAEVCGQARRLPTGDDAAARRFFERFFTPLLVTNRGRPEGLFTGYFEITVKGSLTRDAADPVPIYRRPPDLVTADLGLFRSALHGQHIVGRVADGRLIPYPDRAAIVKGALAGKGLELAWLANPADAFFLEVQGSGRIELPGGGAITVGYAAQNGRPYVSIGRRMIAEGLLKKGNVSLQTIRAWLNAHPRQAQALLDQNPSYVFFRLLPGGVPKGAGGVALTAERSLAIDRRFLPLGVPVWLATTRPAARPGAPAQAFRRLMVTQDTGGAIRGPVRGDVYWGSGPWAEAIAGRMQNRGRYWLLLPKPLAGRALATDR